MDIPSHHQAKQIEQLEALVARQAAVIERKNAALSDTLNAIGALLKPHELIGYGLDQSDIDAIFSALALQPCPEVLHEDRARECARLAEKFAAWPSVCDLLHGEAAAHRARKQATKEEGK